MKKRIVPFNVPPCIGNEIEFISDVITTREIGGDGKYTKKCNKWIENRFEVQRAMLTTSGTTALDMAMLLCDIKPGDEVILPSYTFSSTATSAVLTGARLVFVDIRPDTMNIDEKKIEKAITDKTKAIVVVHYAGISCEMDEILSIAEKYGIKVVEDAAQAIFSEYKGRSLGSIGDFGCFSFHETKNISMGEGGAILIRDPRYNEKAEILREKGTNRTSFYRGMVDKYTWIDFGDSYLPSELNSAFLWGQLNESGRMQEERGMLWDKYHDMLMPLVRSGDITIMNVPEGCKGNYHMFYIKTRNFDERSRLIAFLKEKGVSAVFHYIPLHSSPGGLKYGRFSGEDENTTSESEKILRLPLYYGMTEDDQKYVIDCIYSYMAQKTNGGNG